MTLPNSLYLNSQQYQKVSHAGIPLPEGKFMQIRHDQEAKDDRQRIGMPEVFPLYFSKPCEITAAWQKFCLRLLVHSYSNYQYWDETKISKTVLTTLIAKFTSLYKQTEAFTNFAGFPDAYNFWTGKGGPDNPKQEPLACCGNILKILGAPVRLAGEWKLPIETLDGNRAPPPLEKINKLTAPHLVFCATNVAADKSGGYGHWKPITLPDGRYKVDPFPQMAPKDTLVYLRTNGKETDTYERDGVWYAVNYIQMTRMKEITGSVVPTPYVP